MSDPSRLQLLQFLLRVQLQQVEQTQRWIAVEEQRLAELAARLPPAPAAEWELELDLGRRPTMVHVGGCEMGGRGFRQKVLTRDAALRALGVDHLKPCPFCRPDIELGVLD